MSRTIQISLPSIGLEEWEACKDPILSGWVTQGPAVRKFETAFAERHKVNNALAVTSCTTGLHLALAALGVGEGDEVIVPAFTWVATANVVMYCGAKPVFVDVERETFNIDIKQVSSAVNERTKAIIAVHLFGLCVDMDALRAELPEHVAIVEDAACAAGAAYKGVPAGGLGKVASFSFHPRKSITTGEGGMVTTNDPDLAECMNQLRNHGATISEEQRHNGPKPYSLPDFNQLGYNYRMTDLQGAVGLTQLKKLDQFQDERKHWANWYSEQLNDIKWIKTPKYNSDFVHGWQAYVVYVEPSLAPISRNEIMERLQEKGVSTRPGTHALHMLSFYQDLMKTTDDDFPASRDCNNNSMAIPLHNRMDEDDYRYVVQCLRELDMSV